MCNASTEKKKAKAKKNRKPKKRCYASLAEITNGQ